MTEREWYRARLPESERASFDRWIDRIFTTLRAEVNAADAAEFARPVVTCEVCGRKLWLSMATDGHGWIAAMCDHASGDCPKCAAEPGEHHLPSCHPPAPGKLPLADAKQQCVCRICLARASFARTLGGEART